jgi:hypothetical protein
MARRPRNCADCGENLEPELVREPYFAGRCRTCRRNYETCITCGQLTHLRDMRQVYCRTCRREYDRERWARQRAARGVP